MSLVYGDNVNLYARLSEEDDFAAILCNKSCSLNISTEIVERTTPESGINKQVKAVGLSGTLQADGDVDYDTDIGVENFIDWMLAMSTIFWQLDTLSESNTSITYSGQALIETITLTGPVNAPASFSLSLIIDGAITKS